MGKKTNNQRIVPRRRFTGNKYTNAKKSFSKNYTTSKISLDESSLPVEEESLKDDFFIFMNFGILK